MLTERIFHLCEKIDGLEEKIAALDERIDTLPNSTNDVKHLEMRIRSLEDWHMWGLRILGSAFVLQTIAFIYEMVKK